MTGRHQPRPLLWLLLLAAIAVGSVVLPLSLPSFVSKSLAFGGSRQQGAGEILNAHHYQSGGGEEENIPLHPNSPPEADPNLLRVKRQAYQVYIDDQPSISVDPVEALREAGPWGPWTEGRPCSRTCGGGVTMERRECSGEGCHGPAVRYLSCNTDECPEEDGDFRTAQCAANNDKPLDGNYFKWHPFIGKNRCELTCKPEGSNFYYKWAEKVVDGTRCDALGEEVCVDGVCLPVGCDGKLGSSAKHDKCGVCNGDGSKCKSVEGIFDQGHLSTGYHDVVTLPVGATAIRVNEMRPSGNSLALHNTSGHYFLNGNFLINVGDKTVEAGGTVFKYERAKTGDASSHQVERLSAKGPLKSEVVVALLLEKGGKNVGVRYEYSIPLMEVQYVYKPGEWSGCSVTCGKGSMTRTPFCVDTQANQRVSEELCEESNATKPEWERPCETVQCEADWYTGNWEDCSQSCGEHGWQYRVVYCHRVHSDGRRVTVSDENCTSTERPEVRQSCNRHSCPEWHFGPWSACSEKCGDAKQYRSVTCTSAKEGEEGKLLPAEHCPAKDAEGKEIELESERHCNLGPCDGLHFQTTEWQLCERCNDTEETRNVTCKDATGRPFPLEKCLNETVKEIPTDTRSCASPAPCNYEWHTSQWTKCSTECGHGHRARKAHCAIHEMGDITIVDEALCGGERPVEREECEISDASQCKGKYFSGPWSECSASCAGGTQSRVVVCLDYDHQPKPQWCDESKKPEPERECNTEPCPVCVDSEHGCCPDNTTFAQGPFNQGCSNCSTSEFGCCADNVTEASGPNAKGCPEAAQAIEAKEEAVPEEGSGEEPTEEAITTTPAEEMCEVTNEETGEEITVPCAATISPPSADEVMNIALDLGNGTTTNITAKAAKKKCSKTEFGCCPDWYTPAEGKNREGCPTYVMGTCNGTKWGCCPDEVTLARGPNMEGCGDSACAASLYGCCKDRKTIAFGPHYAGCERSSFPCEISDHGCCPDGETAALGPNGMGCGAGCLLTKYGCCPDGMTMAKGPNNENCGCEYAQYGCCPDGKAAARGPGFFGCPETCAQSQHGCCPDGKTPSRGPNKEGCPCQYTRWGCCQDGETTALGPNRDGCDDCRYAKYGCCPDGTNKATGPNFAGCPSTTPAPYVVGGTISPHKIAACSQPEEKGQVCHPGYRLAWHYDTVEGRCHQFWYGGCGGNGNNFQSEKQCEDICVEPPHLGRCYLPKVEGPQRCNQLTARYWYDHATRQCAAFWWRGCLGNSNNFASWEECQQTCSSVGPLESRAHQPEPYHHHPPVVEVQPQPHYPAHVPPRHPQQQQQHQQQPPYQPSSSAGGAYGAEEAAQPQQMEAEECRQEVDGGNCRAFVDKWYFDAFTARCYPFIYGGCGGNTNRFSSEIECRQRCGHHRPDYTARDRARSQPRVPVETPSATPTETPPHEEEMVRPQPTPQYVDPWSGTRHRQRGGKAKTRDICNLRLDVGRCEGHFESWYYEMATGTCEQFQYTGCGGNGNRFHTKDQCEQLCARQAMASPRFGSVASFAPLSHPDPAAALLGSHGPARQPQQQQRQQPPPQQEHQGHQQQQAEQSVCELPKETGPCSQFKAMWFYNKADGTCNRFHYGGCDGNGNRFDTENACKEECGDHIPTCMLPKVVGPCASRSERYYFDRLTRKCLRFQYGGCLGNTNNFRSINDCEAMCLKDEEGEEDHATIRGNGVTDEGAGGSLTDDDESVVSTVSPQHHHSHHHPHRSDQRQHRGRQQRHHSHSHHSHHPHRHYIEDDQRPTGHPIYSICSLPREVGPCKSYIRAFYYNSTTNICEPFHFGGCSGNGNRFSHYEECVTKCVLLSESDTSKVSTTAHPKTGASSGSNGVHHSHTHQHHNHHHSLQRHGHGDKRAKGLKSGVEKWAKPNHHHHHSHSDHPSSISSAAEERSPQSDELQTGVGLMIEKNSREELAHKEGNTAHRKEEHPGKLAEEEAIEELEGGEDENEGMLATMYPETRYSLPELCKLPEDKGPCYGEELRWRYDSELHACVSMVYTGCGGNANQFTSEEACLRACGPFRLQPVCRTKGERGDCQLAVAKWHYNHSRGECQLFQWSGCGGNGNRFTSRAECEDLCRREESTAPAGEIDVCRLERDSGPCNDPLTQWYYDRNAAECRKFTYGGCRGNANRFNNKAECERECSATARGIPAAASKAACSLAFDSGPCEGSEPRFYYSPAVGRCLPFTYGGCEGNDNRFSRESECIAACGKHEWGLPSKAKGPASLAETQLRRARILSSHVGGPVAHGSAIELKCLVAGDGAREAEVVWYLNGVRLDRGAYGAHRFKFPSRNVLLIENATQQHDGDYSCVGGEGADKLSIISQPLAVVVEQRHLRDSAASLGKKGKAGCDDKGQASVCELVKQTGLCSNVRYGKFCCATCAVNSSNDVV